MPSAASSTPPPSSLYLSLKIGCFADDHSTTQKMRSLSSNAGWSLFAYVSCVLLSRDPCACVCTSVSSLGAWQIHLERYDGWRC